MRHFMSDDKNTAISFKYQLTGKQKRYIAVKRIIDTFIALILLIILIIPFIIISILQKIFALKEHVFFCQKRIGRYGKMITILKFRSMKSSAPRYRATSEFPDSEMYISKFGRLLRNSSIDELPQLFQVVTGHLSLVGPRPLIPQETLAHELRTQAGVYQLRPGITGWAQINGRDCLSDEEKVAFDSEYLQNVGFRTDLKILWRTVGKTCRGEDIHDGESADPKQKK